MVDGKKYDLTKIYDGIKVPVGDKIELADIYEAVIPDTKVPVYFIDNEKYFGRDNLYQNKGVDYPDNCERFTFYSRAVLEFLMKNYDRGKKTVDLLPFIGAKGFVALNIPMDEETPPGRYLRPQAMAEEYITRHWAFPVSYRMNLTKARAGDLIELTRWNCGYPND